MITPAVIDVIMLAFNDVLELATLRLLTPAIWLFWMLSTIFMVMTVIPAMIKAEHPLELAVVIFFSMIKVGLLHWAMQDYLLLTRWLVNTTVAAGLFGGGSLLTPAEFLQPSRIFLQGLQTAAPLTNHWNQISGLNVLLHSGAFVLYLLGMLACWIAFFLIALHVVLAIVGFKIIATFTALFLPFGVLPQLAFMARGPVHALLASATRLGVLALITTVVVRVTARLGMPPNTTPDYWSAINMAAGAWILAVVAWKGPGWAVEFMGGRIAAAGGDIITMAMGAGYVGGRGAVGASQAGAAAFRAARSAARRLRPQEAMYG